MHNYHYRRKNKSKIPLLVILALLIAGSVYIYLSDNFERIAPTITIDEKIYWNLTEPIPLKIEDNYGIKSYKGRKRDYPGSKRGDFREYQADSNGPSIS